jgi:hypothetical protein
MPAESGKTVEERLARLERGDSLLRVALALVAIVFAVALVFLGMQVREQAAATAKGQAGISARPVGASRFTLVELVPIQDPKGKEKTKSIKRAELYVKDKVPRLDIFDTDGEKVIWSTAPGGLTEPKGKESPAPEPKKE